jgi:hypothetical protein
MFRFLCLFIFISFISFSQINSISPSWFKGDHFVIYNKCKTAVLFCESTQQDYTFCGATKNCQGLFVVPGDTFLLNYEDKLQSKTIVADISFQNYLASVPGYTFLPVDSCIPPQPLQIIIPLNAVNGSSFQINAQSPAYYPAESFLPSVPLPIYVYVGGQKPVNTTALSDFTNCPIPQVIDTTTDVFVKELLNINDFIIYPTPLNSTLFIDDKKSQFKNSTIEIKNYLGEIVFSSPFNVEINISELCAGMYFLTLQDKQNKKTVKILKQ